jgi:methionyl-tRNA formyltransferase
MIGTVYILSEGPTFFPLLRADLIRHQPRQNVIHLQSRQDLDGLDRRDLAGARLIGFTTAVIVPPAIIEALGFGAYNFHPGPPDFPGWRPVSFAVYQGVARFGVTAHAMLPAVDAGDIVGTVMFDVPPGTGEAGLNNRMVLALLRLFGHLAPALATRLAPLRTIPLRWGARRYTRADATALCQIAHDIDAHELERRMRAFGAGPSSGRPRIEIQGHAFIAEADRSQAGLAMPGDMAMEAWIGS